MHARIAKLAFQYIQVRSRCINVEPTINLISTRLCCDRTESRTYELVAIVGSIGESVAAGAIFTIPAFVILGMWNVGGFNTKGYGIAKALEDPVVDAVVVLSDGAPSAGRWFTKTDVRAELAKANRWRRARIDVISIGADDGLKKGHTLEVYRNNSYLGRVVVRDTMPDRAVVQIVPEFSKGKIRVGDRVATKLG